ncbi:Hcp family type VI secretion system effector [Crenothrix polyspora]|uniref:Type VI secretion system effector, Hcp1 family n=1 Tax=Crenothrix polyspora TaxID=360316 RepID=A0A1R4HAR7_9GAMM|nr:type VI secretion system tube protein Hcp [Crenothrix polyspora]SJM93121.1 Type VI secretion system effector, Hcp1 family [Crenothrix polyspora]
MATNTYLKIDPIKGESTDKGHEGWIEVFGFSLGVSQPISGPSGTGGRAASRADFTTLGISKSIDTASIDLHMYCAQGTHIAKLELEVCQETGSKVCYWKYELEDVMVQAVNVSGGGSGRPMESVVFVFDVISWTYVPVDNKGTAGTAIGPKKFSLQSNVTE